MEIFGISKRWRKPPFKSPDDKDITSMRNFFEQLNLI
jgi:hypothetical protein